MKIVCDDKIPFLKGVLEPFAEVVYLPGSHIAQKDVVDADALVVRTRTHCNASLLEGTQVKAIATATIGYDHIDTDYCQTHGITWWNAPGCNSSSVMHYLASALCTLADRYHFRLSDIVLGVVGVGHVGTKVARVAEALGCTVLLNDPPRARRENAGDASPFVPLETILDRCNVITLHVPLTQEGEDATYHFFDAARLQQWMHTAHPSLSKDMDAVLINASRGPVVDNQALSAWLAQPDTRLGAVLDTWENEPHLSPELLSRVTLATPHIAGYSLDGKANGTQQSVQHLADFFDFPLKDWQPRQIPFRRESSMRLDTLPNSVEDLMKQLVLQTYSITEDDGMLRKDLSQFEKLRGAYPIRRDIESYSVSLHAEAVSLAAQLQRLGLKITR